MTNVQWSGGQEHWTHKEDSRLFLWNKPASPDAPSAGTILFVHGSSMASQPTFDLHVPGRPHSSVMDWFAERGFDTWCMDNEGYGRSDKQREINFDISNNSGKTGFFINAARNAPADQLAAYRRRYDRCSCHRFLKYPAQARHLDVCETKA